MTEQKLLTQQELIKKHRVRWKKSLGQNFLQDTSYISPIINAARLSKDQIVLEIGPGLGALTSHLAKVAGQVIGIELDYDLAKILQQIFAQEENVTIYQGDALKADYQIYLKEAAQKGNYQPGFVMVANLPYYITTPLILRFLEGPWPWQRQVIMVQKEVAERMAAQPGGKDYGALSVAVQYRAAVSQVCLVPPTAFLPPPGVDSAVVTLERLSEPPVNVADEKAFFAVVKAAFGQRRKTLHNSLASGSLGLEKQTAALWLESCGIDKTRRGETLSLAEFAALANSLP